VLGGYLVLQERMNIGQFVAAEIIIILIINSVEKVLRTIENIYDVLTALEKIGYVTDLELDQDRGYAMIDTDTAISVAARNIYFKFPNDLNPIFDGLSFDIAQKDRVLLKGKSGSGKSLLLQIMAGIHDVERGQLFFNGMSSELYQRESFYQALGVSFPTNQIFEGTLRENITLGRDITDLEITEVARKLNLWDFIIQQPQGMQNILDSGGRRLPRSIIQKVLIARTIINQPKLLLMEDPLQFIAEEEKKTIIDYLMNGSHNWTVVVVSDFVYWSEKCNKVIDLDVDN
ncbi:MAG: ATP-binding cassette domain-containing protein, partial [Saprospiraceae bacterium]|nr:ATP-binding cassette domain-containing protein [Saprospiraceae bacterium]